MRRGSREQAPAELYGKNIFILRAWRVKKVLRFFGEGIDL
jgi:hypothetical protein